MINEKNSRRSFLSSMAILSAGAAFGSVTDFISPQNSAKDLKQLWNSFCTQNNGYPLSALMTEKTAMDTCKGHFPQNGTMIQFSNVNMLAQPTWIYWGSNRSKPADVVITFYHNDHKQTKILRLNRFELEALTEFTTFAQDKNSMISLFETIKKGTPSSKNNTAFIAKTTIKNGKDATTFARHVGKKISFKTKLIYNT